MNTFLHNISPVAVPILGLLIAIIDIALIIINKKQENTIKRLNATLEEERALKETQKNNPILIDYLNRGEGKSIRICYLSEMLKSPVIVHSVRQREFIKVQAKTLGINIPNVFTVSELKNHPEHMSVVVDDWEMFTQAEKTYISSRYDVKALSYDSKAL